jgi:DNA polymerase
VVEAPAAGAAGGAHGLTRAQAQVLLSELQQEVAACRRCEELACSRTQTVFGVGSPQPQLCFLGEAPGADEDRQGEPFVGAAGKLLTTIIENAMGLRREDVYILNVLKCRPPQNRDPLAQEAENCRPFFERQLEILQPQFICCLGAHAAWNLLDTNKSVARLRGRFFPYQQSQVMVTYHPAYLLRAPEAKRKTWEDIKMLMGAMKLQRKA